MSNQKKKRWRVVNHHCYIIREGKYHYGGTTFEATEDEVARQRYKLEEADPPPREAPPEQMQPRRRGRPPKNRQMTPEGSGYKTEPAGHYETK